MPRVKANGIEIEFDTFGNRTSRPLLLIMGVGRQLVSWNEDFCQRLADNDLFVIRFDNRDVGLSTKFEGAGIPDLTNLLTASIEEKKSKAPYSLEDMADDAVGLLDVLAIQKAHICGASMGAAITQIIGYKHPSRVLSLISIMGSTGNPGLPQAKPTAMEVLMAPVPEKREDHLKSVLNRLRILWGSMTFDEADMQRRAELEYDRAFYPQGMVRQMAAILADGNRKPKLKSITAPTLIIHGSEDPLVPWEGGKDTAEAIPGAKLLIIDRMGHGLPREAWPQIIKAIFEHIQKAAG
ncbi:MAG: alpha/beta hydrolase [Thermodesulfobacteriota bacterium]